MKRRRAIMTTPTLRSVDEERDNGLASRTVVGQESNLVRRVDDGPRQLFVSGSG